MRERESASELLYPVIILESPEEPLRYFAYLITGKYFGFLPRAMFCAATLPPPPRHTIRAAICIQTKRHQTVVNDRIALYHTVLYGPEHASTVDIVFENLTHSQLKMAHKGKGFH